MALPRRRWARWSRSTSTGASTTASRSSHARSRVTVRSMRPGSSRAWGSSGFPRSIPPALDRFYTALRKSGSLRRPGGALSASRLRDVHAVISGALGLAARYGWVPYNPAALVKPPAPQSAKRAMPTRGQARAALDAAAAAHRPRAMNWTPSARRGRRSPMTSLLRRVVAGHREALRVLLATRHSACAAKVSATNQLKALIVRAPEELRAELRGLATRRQIARCARLRDRPSRSLEHRMTVRALARPPNASSVWPSRPPGCGPNWTGWWPRWRRGCWSGRCWADQCRAAAGQTLL